MANNDGARLLFSSPSFRLLWAFSLAGMACASSAAEISDAVCERGELNHYEEALCLAKEYKGTDALLRQKVDQMVRMAGSSDRAGMTVDAVAAARKRLREQLRRADQA